MAVHRSQISPWISVKGGDVRIRGIRLTRCLVVQLYSRMGGGGDSTSLEDVIPVN